MNGIEDYPAFFFANRRRKGLRIEFKLLDVVIFGAKGICNSLARAPRNFRLRRRSARYYDNFFLPVLFKHFQKFFPRSEYVARAHRYYQIARRQLIFYRGGDVFALWNVTHGLIRRAQHFPQYRFAAYSRNLFFARRVNVRQYQIICLAKCAAEFFQQKFCPRISVRLEYAKNFIRLGLACRSERRRYFRRVVRVVVDD